MDVGCSLEFQRANILCYADDMVLLAPTVTALQLMLNQVQRMLDNLGLKINIDKSQCLALSHNKKFIDFYAHLNGERLVITRSIKYLGVFFSYDFSIDNDINRIMESFLKQFNCFYHKCNFLPNNILNFLFKTYSTSFYGIGSWYSFRHSFRTLSVAYHKAIKKLAGMRVWQSNHDACEKIGVNTIKHLISKRMLAQFKGICNSTSETMYKLRYFYIYKSKMKENINSRLWNISSLNHFYPI